ncbi:hypothetical protein C8J57DRAFT_1232890 [Mycena rebaudengoi]|nr:hypothetical protein C8J57DRAFT_1232890 [Mycena rebaudengoi]
MAPTGWTTGAQLTWLKSKLTNYMEMQAQGKLHKFWPSVFEAWFHDFPEHAHLNFPLPNALGDAPALTSAQMDALGAAIKKRKDQLQNWFRHQRVKLLRAGPLVRRSEASMANVLFGKKKKERRHQPIELFQMAHKSEIRAALSAAGYDAIRVDNSTFIDEADETQMKLLKSQNSERMRLRAKVVQALYSAAPDSERAMFMDKAGAEQAKGVPEAVGKEERTPEEYQANIDQVCSVMGKVHEAVGTMAGWSGFTVVGGPNPNYGGELSMRVICLGVSPAGHDFQKAHPNFDAAITVPFQTFLRGIYPADVRFSRALTSEAPAEGSGVDNPTATLDNDSEAAPEAAAQSTKAKPKRRSKKKKAAPAPAASAALSLDTAQDDSLEQDGSLDTSSTGLAVLEAAGLSSFSNSPLDNVSLSSPASPHTADDEGDFFGSSVDASLHSGLLYSFGSVGGAGGSTEQGSDLPGWARGFDADLVSPLSQGSLETPTKRSSYQPSGLFAAFNSPRNSLSSASSQGLSWPSSATPRGRSSWSDFLGTTSTNPPELNYPPPPPRPPKRPAPTTPTPLTDTGPLTSATTSAPNKTTAIAAAVAALSQGKAAARAQRLGTAGKEIFLAVLKANTSPPLQAPPPPLQPPPSELAPTSRPEVSPPLRPMASQAPVFGSPSKNKPVRTRLEKQPVKRGGNVGAPAAAPVLGKRASGSVEDGQASLGVGRRVRRKVLDANGEEMQLPVKKTRKEQAEEKAAKAVTATKKKPAAAAAKGKGRATAHIWAGDRDTSRRLKGGAGIHILRIELGTPESKINNTSAASTTAPNTTLLIKLDDEQDRGKKKKPRNRTDESGSGPESAPGRRKCL